MLPLLVVMGPRRFDSRIVCSGVLLVAVVSSGDRWTLKDVVLVLVIKVHPRLMMLMIITAADWVVIVEFNFVVKWLRCSWGVFGNTPRLLHSFVIDILVQIGFHVWKMMK